MWDIPLEATTDSKKRLVLKGNVSKELLINN